MDDHFLTREKLLSVHKHPNFKWIIFFFGIIIFCDLLFLNYKLLNEPKNISTNVSKQVNSDKQANDQGVSVTKQEDTCGAICMSEINKAISTLSSQKTSQDHVSTNPTAKEYFIPFGTGAISSTDWQDVPGLQATINGSSYGVIKSATFEVSIHVPTGNETAEVQLFNVTAGHPVWFSDLIFSGGSTPQFLTSPPVTLDPGSNSYKVQMKTQLGYSANLDQARVHITTN